MADQIPEGAIPEEEFHPQPSATPPGVPAGAIPADQFQSDAHNYGSGTEMLKTAVEQGLSGATLGASKVLETKLLGVKPEDIAGREAENPITSTLSNLGGTTGLLLGTGGLGGLAEGAEVATKLALGAAEGAGIGGISQATDDWSQNKALDAQKIAASAGLGGLLGGIGAGIGEGIKYKYGTPLAKNAKSAIEEAATPLEGAAPVVEAPMGVKGVKPTSLQEIGDAVLKAKENGTSIDLPAKAELQDAISRVAMEHPVNPAQLDSLGSQAERDVYQIAKETPGKNGSDLSQYEALQKKSLVDGTQKAIADIVPGIEPEADAYKAGHTAIDAFTTQYQNEKEALAPIFKSLKGQELSSDITVDAIPRIVKAIPASAEMFDATGAEIGFHPYSTHWGIDKATYTAVKQAVKDMEKAPNTLESLWNIRKGLDQSIDVLAQGQAPAEIRAVKAALMDQMQEASGNPQIRDAFRRYAINEQQRAVIEKTFGAKVGTPEFGAISKVSPEKIGDKVFSNTASVDAAKKILPPEEFKTILANWIAHAKESVTDKGAFSSNKFGRFLNKNKSVLDVAFADHPEKLQHLRDLTTIMRILPDAPPVVVGSGKTILGLLKGGDLHNLTSEGMMAAIPKKVLEALVEHRQTQKLNEALAGQSAKNATQQALQKHVETFNNRLDRGVKALFSGSASQTRKAQ